MDKQDAPGTAQEARSPCSAGGDKGPGPSLNDWLYFVSLILLGVSLGFMMVALFRTMG